MKVALAIAARGFVYVFIASVNIVQITRGHSLAAPVGSALLYTLWWSNARKEDHRLGALLYGLGAGLGTAAGMAVSRLI